MTRVLLFVLLFVSSLCASAQYFNYRHDYRPREEERAPRFKDGEKGIERFVRKNFKNPDGGRGLNGEIVVEVLINEKGRVTDCRVLQGLERRYDEEAVRVSKKMRFEPARIGKRKVKSRFRILFPIKRGRLSYSTLNTIEV